MRLGKVPQGRLRRLPRHGPGFGQTIGNSQSRNILRWKRLGLPLSYFQSSLRDFSSLESLPRTTSWAKFNRPCGTEFGNGVHTRAPKAPALCSAQNRLETSISLRMRALADPLNLGLYGAAWCFLNRCLEMSGQNSTNSAPITPSAVTVSAPSSVCSTPRSAAG